MSRERDGSGRRNRAGGVEGREGSVTPPALGDEWMSPVNRDTSKDGRLGLAEREEAGLVAIIFRLAFLLAFLVVCMVNLAVRPAFLPGIRYGLVIGAAVYCWAVLVIYARCGYVPWLRPVTLVIDLGLVTILIVSVPAAGQGFFPVYYLLVVMGAMEFGLVGALGTGLLASLFYALAKFGTALGLPLSALWAALTTEIPWILLVAVAAGLMSRAHQRALLAERDLITARSLQRMLFPARLPATPGYEVGHALEYGGEVGGDYFDVLAAGEGEAGICIADITGRGVPAALDISLLKHAVHAAVEALHEPRAIAEHVNKMLYPHFESLRFERFVSMFYGLLELESGALTYVNCGHVPPRLLHASGGSEVLFTRGIVIGTVQQPSYEEHEAGVEPGDVLVLCTDGVSGARNREGDEFGMERVEAAARARLDGSAQEIADAILAAVSEFAGGGHDDLSALVVKRLRGEGEEVGQEALRQAEDRLLASVGPGTAEGPAPATSAGSAMPPPAASQRPPTTRASRGETPLLQVGADGREGFWAGRKEVASAGNTSWSRTTAAPSRAAGS